MPTPPTRPDRSRERERLDARPRLRHRRRAAVLLVGVVLLGLAIQLVRDRLPGADLAGTALYTVAVACVVSIVAPTATASRTATIAVAISVAVELFQLTPWPAAAARAFRPAALVLGSTYSARDLLGYALGGLVAWWLLRRL